MTAPSRPIEPPVTIVGPTTQGASADLREMWEYREILTTLVWRGVKIRYKQTLLGATWVILQPLLTMLVLSLLLARFARIPSDDIPYPLFAYAGLVIWLFFTNALTQATQSLLDHQEMIRRVYFPRVLLPLAGVLGAGVDVLLSLPIVLGLMVYFGVGSSNLWLAPAFLVLAAAFALGVGLWLSALNVRYRDIRYTIPFILQLWLLATPVIYPSSLLPERWTFLYGLNPMAGVVEGFRWALLGGRPFPGKLLIVSVCVISLGVASGIVFFRRMEPTFADVV